MGGGIVGEDRIGDRMLLDKQSREAPFMREGTSKKLKHFVDSPRSRSDKERAARR